MFTDLKRYFFATVALLAGMAGAMAQTAAQETLFPYPTVPDNIESFTERSNYFMEHFWDRANLKQSFSTKQKLQSAFLDFVGFMPYADSETVHSTIDKLITNVEKTGANNLLTLAEMAEAALYSDTAAIVCDECYLPFAKAVVGNRKISKAQKSRFEYQAKALESSMVGQTAPDFTYTMADGTTGRLSDVKPGAYVLLFINDPDCDECQLARVRLSADLNLNEMANAGLIKVMSIYPGEPDDEWREKVAGYNKNWIVGACPDIDEILDMRNPPVLYYLNGKHEILSKTLAVDNLLEAFRVVNQKMKNSKQQASKAAAMVSDGAVEPATSTGAAE